MRGLGGRTTSAPLLDNGYNELPIISDHVVAIESLPPIHRDSFDRLLVGQATVEGVTLLTLDPLVAQYPGPIQVRNGRGDGPAARRWRRPPLLRLCVS